MLTGGPSDFLKAEPGDSDLSENLLLDRFSGCEAGGGACLIDVRNPLGSPERARLKLLSLLVDPRRLRDKGACEVCSEAPLRCAEPFWGAEEVTTADAGRVSACLVWPGGASPALPASDPSVRMDLRRRGVLFPVAADS